MRKSIQLSNSLPHLLRGVREVAKIATVALAVCVCASSAGTGGGGTNAGGFFAVAVRAATKELSPPPIGALSTVRQQLQAFLDSGDLTGFYQKAFDISRTREWISDRDAKVEKLRSNMEDKEWFAYLVINAPFLSDAQISEGVAGGGSFNVCCDIRAKRAANDIVSSILENNKQYQEMLKKVYFKRFGEERGDFFPEETMRKIYQNHVEYMVALSGRTKATYLAMKAQPKPAYRGVSDRLHALRWTLGPYAPGNSKVFVTKLAWAKNDCIGKGYSYDVRQFLIDGGYETDKARYEAISSAFPRTGATAWLYAGTNYTPSGAEGSSGTGDAPAASPLRKKAAPTQK